MGLLRKDNDLGLKAQLVADKAPARSTRPSVPWFVLGFVALVCVNSVIPIPANARKMIVTLTTFLLSVALAAMGLETDISKLYARGLRPAILGAAAFLFIECIATWRPPQFRMTLG